MRLCAPNPMNPLITVAPASPRLRASSTIASYSGLPCQRSASPTKIRSSLPSVGNDIARPQSYKSCDDLPDDVHDGCGELPVAQQGKTLERVGRKGREPAQYADEEECAQVRRELDALFGSAGNRAEHDAPDDIHAEGAKRKQRSRRAENGARKQKARDGPERAADRDQQKLHAKAHRIQ